MTDATPDVLDVVHIVGKGRSGSTLLDDLLGTMPGTVATGELRLLWDDRYGFSADHRCTCGQALPDCPVWGSAVRRVLGDDLDPGRVRATERLRRRVETWPRVPAQLAGRADEAAREYGRVLGELYRGLAAATGATTIVDSSKWPAHVGLLGLVPGVRPWLVHLVRDPRAVAHSYTRVRAHPGQPPLPRFGPVHTAASWGARNLAAEVVARRVPAERRRVLRYEDLAATPRSTMADLGTWLGNPDPTRAFLDASTVRFGTAHVMGGNPRRFERGDVVIRPDVEWRDTAPTWRSLLVTGLTAPLLPRYGYALRPR